MVALVFIVVPDSIGDGTWLKERLVWIILLMALVATSRTNKSFNVHLPVALIAAPVIAIQLAMGAQTVRRITPSVEMFSAIAPALSPESSLLLVTFKTPSLINRYDLEKVLFDPLRHCFERVAAERRLLIWNDYQGVTNQFPLTYSDDLKPVLRQFLGNDRADDTSRFENVKRLFQSTPQRPKYVLIEGQPWADDQTPAMRTDFERLSTFLHSDYVLSEDSANLEYLRLFKKR